MNQREMPWFSKLQQAKWVDQGIVDSWETYRDAVVWVWENRAKGKGLSEPYDQSLCAQVIGCHAPHFSRFVNRDSKAPMDLRADMIPAFEAYTGWRGVSQFSAKLCCVTLMEEVIGRKAA